jgi:hypothetical protein
MVCACFRSESCTALWLPRPGGLGGDLVLPAAAAHAAWLALVAAGARAVGMRDMEAVVAAVGGLTCVARAGARAGGRASLVSLDIVLLGAWRALCVCVCVCVCVCFCVCVC